MSGITVFSMGSMIETPVLKVYAGKIWGINAINKEAVSACHAMVLYKFSYKITV